MGIIDFTNVLTNAIEISLLASLFLLISKLLFFGLGEMDYFGLSFKPALNSGLISNKSSFGKRIPPEKISLSKQRTYRRAKF